MGRKRKNPADGEPVAEAQSSAPETSDEFNPIAAYYKSWALAKAGALQDKLEQEAGIDPDIQELCDNFHIEERHCKKLNEIMQTRIETFEADMLRLWTDLERAHNPNGLLVVQMRQMGEGTFIGKNKPDPEYEEIVKKFKLDEQAEEKLLDTLSRHPIERRREYYKELHEHLAASNKASATAMMLLRKVGENEPLGMPPRPKGAGKGEKGDKGDKGGDWNRDRGQDRDWDNRDSGSSRDGYRDRDRSDRDRRDGGRDWDRGQGWQGSSRDRGSDGDSHRDRGGDRWSSRDW